MTQLRDGMFGVSNSDLAPLSSVCDAIKSLLAPKHFFEHLVFTTNWLDHLPIGSGSPIRDLELDSYECLEDDQTITFVHCIQSFL